MASMKRSVVVHAPVEKVYNYLNDPNKLTEYWPGFVDVKDVRMLDNGGSCFHYVYKMAGLRLEGYSEDTEIIPNQRMVSKSIGAIESTVIWEVEPVDDGTKVDFELTYKVPVPVLGKLAENAIVKLSEREADAIMENMKVMLEEAR